MLVKRCEYCNQLFEASGRKRRFCSPEHANIVIHTGEKSSWWKGGYSRHPLYRTWYNMIQRCYNPQFPRYENYGGRGITVCDRWRNSFPEFVVDVGSKPEPNFTLDRIDLNKNYEPSNVRWASPKENLTRRTVAA